jgi:hypothetical protein
VTEIDDRTGERRRAVDRATDPITGFASGRFYAWWIVANAIGECVGLGGTAAVTALAWSALDEAALGVGLLIALGIALAGALVEGTVVGTAQWLVLRVPLRGMRWRWWALATALGAFVAWALGMLPSTIVQALAESDAAGGAAVEPSLALQMALAAGMGLVLGPILGGFQWPVLRHHVPRAGRWLAANALAWAAGMPIIFLAAGSAPRDVTTGGLVMLVGGALLAAGAVVGAVHGVFLLKMIREA